MVTVNRISFRVFFCCVGTSRALDGRISHNAVWDESPSLAQNSSNINPARRTHFESHSLESLINCVLLPNPLHIQNELIVIVLTEKVAYAIIEPDVFERSPGTKGSQNANKASRINDAPQIRRNLAFAVS